MLASVLHISQEKVLVSQAFPAKKAQQPKIDVGGPEKLIIFSWPNLRLYFCMVAKHWINT